MQWLNLDDTNLNALAAIAMYLAQGCWPNLKSLHLLENLIQLNVEAVAYLVKGEWPLLEELNVSWTSVPKAALEVLGVVDTRKQFQSRKRKEKFTLFSDRNGSLLRRQPGASFEHHTV